MKANQYFKDKFEQLQQSKFKHKARAKYNDGTDAYKTSIYQVFEKYNKCELPIHTMRETAIKSAIQEMLWIYKDQTNCLDAAHKRGIFWWDKFEVGDNTIGKAYGYTINEQESVYIMLDEMLYNPFSQRHILNLWDNDNNEYQSKVKGLVPCAYQSIFSIIQDGDKRLVNMHLNIRSSDYVAAGAINRIQYYALGLMICGHLTYVTEITHELNDFSVFTQDLHIYDRHEFAIDEILNQKPISEPYTLRMSEPKNFYNYDIEDFIFTKPKGLLKLSKPLELAI